MSEGKLQTRLRSLRGDGTNHPWEDASAGYQTWFKFLSDATLEKLHNGEILPTTRFGGLLEEEVRFVKE